jgi:multidrug resistance protein
MSSQSTSFENLMVMNKTTNAKPNDGSIKADHYSGDKTQDLEKDAGDNGGNKKTVKAEKKAPIDPFIVQWDGKDDQENVQTQKSLLVRWIYAVIISACSIIITCASSIYSMAMERVGEQFHKSHTVTAIGICFFLLGMGWGPIFLAPISEFYGRRIVYIFSFLFMFPFQLMTGFANNMATLLIGRFLAGFSGSAFLGVASGSFSDLFDQDEIMLPVMMYTLTPFIGPGLGPLIGGFIVHNVNWRWTDFVMAIAVAVMLIFITFVVPETYAPVLLKKKAKRLRKTLNDDRYYAPIERSTESIVDTIFLSCKRPMMMLVLEPMLTLLCIYSGLLLALLYLFFVSYPYVFRTVYNFDETQIGLTFIGLVVGCLAAAPTVIFNKHYIVPKCIECNTKTNHIYEPEFQLPQTFFGTLMVPIGLFIFGWSAQPHLHWMGPVIGGGIILFGLIICYNGIFAFTIDAYHTFAASAMACNGVVRSTLGSVFPLFGLQMYENLGIPWATSMLAFICLAFVPMPILLFKYGLQIRAKSKFAWSQTY